MEGQGVAGGVDEQEQYLQPSDQLVVCQTPVEVHPLVQPEKGAQPVEEGQKQAEHIQFEEEVLEQGEGQGVAEQKEHTL
jgi:hypothetical protein